MSLTMIWTIIRTMIWRWNHQLCNLNLSAHIFLTSSLWLLTSCESLTKCRRTETSMCITLQMWHERQCKETSSFVVKEKPLMTKRHSNGIWDLSSKWSYSKARFNHDSAECFIHSFRRKESWMHPLIHYCWEDICDATLTTMTVVQNDCISWSVLLDVTKRRPRLLCISIISSKNTIKISFDHRDRKNFVFSSRKAICWLVSHLGIFIIVFINSRFLPSPRASSGRRPTDLC